MEGAEKPSCKFSSKGLGRLDSFLVVKETSKEVKEVEVVYDNSEEVRERETELGEDSVIKLKRMNPKTTLDLYRGLLSLEKGHMK